jgi:hypothetical protein
MTVVIGDTAQDAYCLSLTDPLLLMGNSGWLTFEPREPAAQLRAFTICSTPDVRRRFKMVLNHPLVSCGPFPFTSTVLLTVIA